MPKAGRDVSNGFLKISVIQTVGSGLGFRIVQVL